MNAWHRIAAAAVAAAVVLALWLGRYDLSPAGEGMGVYRLDRWTGAVRVFTANWSRDVEPEK